MYLRYQIIILEVVGGLVWDYLFQENFPLLWLTNIHFHYDGWQDPFLFMSEEMIFHIQSSFTYLHSFSCCHIASRIIYSDKNHLKTHLYQPPHETDGVELLMDSSFTFNIQTSRVPGEAEVTESRLNTFQPLPDNAAAEQRCNCDSFVCRRIRFVSSTESRIYT